MLPFRHSKPTQVAGLVLGFAMQSVAPASAGFDEDGKLDAIFANDVDSTLIPQPDRVCLGDGASGFDCSDLSGGTRSLGVGVGDLNDDRHLDAVFATRGQRNQVCLGVGNGDFVCSDIGSDIVNSDAVAIGDLNNDGDLDAVFASTIDLPHQVCLGDGDGGFECREVGPEVDGSEDVALGDINGDGDLDAVFTSNTSGQASLVCLGDGAGDLECSDIDLTEIITFGVALGYVNDDGHLDAVFANSPFIVDFDVSQRNRVCLGDGAGGFDCSDISSDGGEDVAVGDVDGDGFLDAVFAAIGENLVCLGDGAGGFDCSNFSSAATVATRVALGDVDGDSNLDAVFANHIQPNQVCLGDGNGGFGGFGRGGDECGDVSSQADATSRVALTDTDLDGVQDNKDSCIPSDIRRAVWINGSNTAVENDLTDTTVPTLIASTLGCTVADLVQETADISVDRAEFLRNLQVILRELLRQRTLTRAEALTLSTAAAEADLP